MPSSDQTVDDFLKAAEEDTEFVWVGGIHPVVPKEYIRFLFERVGSICKFCFRTRLDDPVESQALIKYDNMDDKEEAIHRMDGFWLIDGGLAVGWCGDRPPDSLF